ncbi:MAG TPA: hypothetical protein VGX25_13005 [Actinophytocola sp.]|uniref:hypothetical protein n=1 Tax=Actinophytocola sp. TaxID=1872138 RepID=UPI002DDCFF8D|nr:hypothetical protein [Actinophytocola sp.]HEV2780304.1 hypothetical protein [Actinophytocola sp.]
MTDRLDVVEVALRDLGAHLAVPEPPDVTDAVLARLDEPPARPRFGQSRLVKVAAVVLAVLVALGALITVSPPVRAAVLNLLRFAGIELRTDSAPPASLPPSPAPLPNERVVDLPTARQLSRFPVAVAEALGPPERVLLIDGTPPRMVSLLYRGGTVRLDQFDGTLDLALYKKLVGGEGFDWVQRPGGEPAIWVDRPHEVVYVDRDGHEHVESARLSGRTLIWQAGNVTMRLEGDLSVGEALEIAGSVR